jgi:plasmid maintenance system killer protein
LTHAIKGLICSIGLSLLLVGCMDSDKKVDSEREVHNQFESVQDYTGEGYTLKNGEETDRIAEEHRKEVESAVKDFFLKKYKTDVKVHNVVGNEAGATVFVESTDPLHFYTYAVVPINQSEERVQSDRVFSQEGQVESAITEGLYRKIFHEKFERLDGYVKKIVKEEHVTGRTFESLQNVGGSGYMTPYYFLSSSVVNNEAIKPVYELYMKDPRVSTEKLRAAYNEEVFNPSDFEVVINLFMSDTGADPDEKVFNRVVHDIETMEGIPKGIYSIFVNDNFVFKQSFEGIKENSLERTTPDEIVKD